MARHSPSVRGISSVRTLAGRSDTSSSPQKAYLRLSLIELESARYAQEIVAVQRRLAALQARSREMDTEKAALLAGVTMPIHERERIGTGLLRPAFQARERFKHSY
jgi:hypothetical protein